MPVYRGLSDTVRRTGRSCAGYGGIIGTNTVSKAENILGTIKFSVNYKFFCKNTSILLSDASYTCRSHIMYLVKTMKHTVKKHISGRNRPEVW